MQRALRVALTRLRHALSPTRQMRGDGDACELRRATTYKLRTDAFVSAALPNGNDRRRVGNTCLTVEISPSLLPVLMPILARLRHLFDLDAEPTVIDAHLTQSGLGAFVRRTPGLRMPGAFDGFEAALALVLRRSARGANGLETIRRVVVALGEPADPSSRPLEK